MARQSASFTSILNAYFHPKTAPKITGLRRKTLKLTAGRKKTRVTQFNKLEPLQQLVLERTGTREAYLRGEVTIAQVKQSVRPQAVERGVAKPIIRDDLVTANILKYAEQRPVRRKQSDIVPETIRDNVEVRMTPEQKREAIRIRSYDDLLALINGTMDESGYSPFFYK